MPSNASYVYIYIYICLCRNDSLVPKPSYQSPSSERDFVFNTAIIDYFVATVNKIVIA